MRTTSRVLPLLLSVLIASTASAQDRSFIVVRDDGTVATHALRTGADVQAISDAVYADWETAATRSRRHHEPWDAPGPPPVRVTTYDPTRFAAALFAPDDDAGTSLVPSGSPSRSPSQRRDDGVPADPRRVERHHDARTATWRLTRPPL
jgi:hypothetical protein